MPELVTVSSIERNEKLTAYIERLFEKGLYNEIMLAIGMHSVLIDPQHTITEQNRLYNFVLAIIKKKISSQYPQAYSSWLSSFPEIISSIAESREVVTDMAAADTLASRHAAFGPFKSVDEFYFWALGDRRLTLDHIIKYIEKTVERHKKKA